MKATIYPNLPYDENITANPYIRDLISALCTSGVQVSNPPHKNPLFSICFKKIDSDIYFFHWIEDIANHKYGYLQAFMAFIFLLRIKLCKKKTVWFLHNREGHTIKHPQIRKRLVKTLTKYAGYIITHASDGVEVIEPAFRKKVIHIDHPTKNRIRTDEKLQAASPSSDILIWGTISRYKGILEYLRFNTETHSTLRIKIAGKCSDEQLLKELQAEQTSFVDLENRSISFEELHLYIRDAKFVLIPYSAESILCSGVLMDSLSFGAKVIGPNVGSFKDYCHSTEVNVYTFEKFEDIEHIVSSDTRSVSIEGYTRFLQHNSWNNFVRRLLSIIKE